MTGLLLPTSSLPEGDFRQIMARARWDVPFFARRLLNVDPHPGQERLFRAYIMRNSTRWRPAHLTIATSAGNRAGKTLGESIVLAHSTMFKMGRRPPDYHDLKSVDLWSREPYDWYHFGLQQETAELAYTEIRRMLQGTHEAQKGRGCPLVDEFLGPEVAELERKDRGEYVWLTFHPILGGGQIHFRSTSEKALGSLGKDMDGISYDEAAIDPNFDFVVNEVLHLRRLSTGGQLLLTGTSTEGLNAFADKWNDGDPDAPDRNPDAYSLRMSTRENIGYGIDQDMFDRLLRGMPEYLIPQNIDGYFIEARHAFFSAEAVDAMFKADLPNVEIAQKGHRYAHGVDPALTFDSTWGIVLDRTDPENVRGVWAQRKSGRQTVSVVASAIIEGHRSYLTEFSYCSTAFDATGFGGKVFKDILRDLHPLRGVEFGGTRAKKLRMLNNLKGAIEKGRLSFPRSGIWLALRRQLLGYKLDDRKIEQDAVMALAVAWDECERNKSGFNNSEDFDFWASGTADRVPSPRGSVLAGRTRMTVLTREEWRGSGGS